MKLRSNIAYLLYCLCFFAVCAVPGLMMLFPGKQADTSENRRLAELPQLRNEDNTWNRDWSSQFQAYTSDHFGFRRQLIAANSRLNAALLQTSTVEDVIIGRDGWLYYQPTTDDFIGRQTVSQLGILNIRHNLEMMQAFAAAHDAQLVVAVVPNKNTVYPAYMPYYEQRSGESNNLATLREAIADSNVNWCDLAQVLCAQAAEDDMLLYHKTDTHWNNHGALAGYRAIMESTGLPFNGYADASCTAEWTWNGDLEKMLFLDAGAPDEQYRYDIGWTYQYQGHYQDTDDITINTLNPSGSGSLLMFRDSFGAALIPYFSQQFQSARYSRARPNPLYLAEAVHYDVVVLEIVERNIAWLQKEAPMHAAMQVQDVPEAPGTCTASLYTDQNGSELVQLYGTVELPQGLHTAPTYYITLTRGDASVSYMAYNCFEADKLGTAEIGDNGYSLYLPADGLNGCEVTLTAVTDAGSYTCALGQLLT